MFVNIEYFPGLANGPVKSIVVNFDHVYSMEVDGAGLTIIKTEKQTYVSSTPIDQILLQIQGTN